jgi:hypothetical protein
LVKEKITDQWDKDEKESASCIVGQVAPKNSGKARDQPCSSGNNITLDDGVSFRLEPDSEKSCRHGGTAVELEEMNKISVSFLFSSCFCNSKKLEKE